MSPSDEKTVRVRLTGDNAHILGIDPESFRLRPTFSELQKEQGVTGQFDVEDLFDSESSEEELDTYEALLRRLAE